MLTAHPSMASVPITVLQYNGPLLCGFNMGIKALRHSMVWFSFILSDLMFLVRLLQLLPCYCVLHLMYFVTNELQQMKYAASRTF